MLINSLDIYTTEHIPLLKLHQDVPVHI